MLMNSPSVCAEPWSVDDLLHEDDIIDKVPLQKLQLLGTGPILHLVITLLLTAAGV